MDRIQPAPNPQSPAPSPQPRAPNLPRSGFTLVELLLVIVIIGMLVALVSVAAVQVVARARQAENTLTIDTLDQAIQNVKNQYGSYPPDCSNLGPQSGVTTTPTFGQTYRQNRILAYFRKAFPRMTVSGYGPVTTPGTLQALSQLAFGNTSPIQAYTSGNPNLKLGDLDNLDPAEALVLFLGGPPGVNTTVPTPQAGQQLTANGNFGYSLPGFSANPQNPFTQIPQGSPRVTTLYQFNQGRLGDADGDGWPEYYPPNASVPQPPGTSAVQPATATPPYVYFDGVTYEAWITNYGITSTATTAGLQYPGAYPFLTNLSTNPVQPTNFANFWGLAIPYVSSTIVNATINSNDFVNPQKFQIIGAGADNMYATPPGLPGAVASANGLRYFPAGINSNFSQGDLDNVSNFAGGKLQDTPAQ